MSQIYNFKFSSNHVKIVETGEINVNNVFYLAQCIKNIISTCNQHKIIRDILHFFHTKSLKSGLYLMIMACLNLD